MTKYTSDEKRRGLYTISFATDVPTEVIVATCEAAAAKGARHA